MATEAYGEIQRLQTVPLIDDRSGSQSGYCSYSATILNSGGGGYDLSCLIIEENLLTVYIDEQPILHMNCTPIMMPQMVIGRLYSSGMISDIEEIACVSIHSDGRCAELHMASPKRLCTEKTALNTSASQWNPHEQVRPLTALAAHTWNERNMFSTASLFYEESELYRKTHGTHSCLLGTAGKVRYFCEDISRHSALDKAVGCALLDKAMLNEAFVYISGRVAADIVAKVIKCGIPVLASKSVPSKQAIELAGQYGLTLLCAVKPDSMIIYNP